MCESGPPGVLDLSRMWKTLDFLAAALSYNELTVTSGFRAFDKDGDGRVSIEDLRQSMHDLEQTMQPCELQILFNFMDTDRDGFISETEWSTALRHAVPFSTPSRLQVPLAAEASMMQTIESFEIIKEQLRKCLAENRNMKAALEHYHIRAELEEDLGNIRKTSSKPQIELSSVRQQMSRVASRGYTAVPLGHDRRLVAANEPPAIIRYYEVSGPGRVVPVPGPERIVGKILEKTVEVPGPERVVEVPGPERIVYVDRVVESAVSTIKADEVPVERTVEKIEVPGPERIVEVKGPERIVYTEKIVEKIVEVPGPERIVEKIVEKTVEVPGPERVVEVPGPERIVYVDRVVESSASTIKTAEVPVERTVEKKLHDNVNRCASLERVDTLEREFDLALTEIVNLRRDLNSIRPCSYRCRPVSRSVVWPLCRRVGLSRQRERETEKRDNPMVLSRCQNPWCPCRRDYSDLIARNPDNPVSIILHNRDVTRPSSCTTFSKLASLYGKSYTFRPNTKWSGDSVTRLYLNPSLNTAGLRNPREWKQSQETQQMSVPF